MPSGEVPRIEGGWVLAWTSQKGPLQTGPSSQATCTVNSNKTKCEEELHSCHLSPSEGRS
ncbi:hypothetical protein ACRRTK_008928 [Alexandromys fortis]